MKRFLCLLALLACEVDASTYDCATFEVQIFGNTICSGKPGVASRIPAGTCVPTPREVLTGRYFETPYDHWGIQPWDIYSVNTQSGYGKRACEAKLKVEGSATNLGKCNFGRQFCQGCRGSAWKVVCAPSSSTSSGERSKGLQALMYVLTGILGLFGLTLLVLLVVSCFTKKAEPQPTRAGTPNVDGAAGWGPFGFLFPRSWVFVWWGYLAMLLFSSIILPQILDALPSIYSSPDAMQQSETLETILSIGPFIHCVLMPFLWTHKHRQVKKRIENQRDAEVVETSELDPEAKTVIFSMKLGCGQRCKILLVDMTMGLVEFVLWCIKRGSLGTVNLSAYWFPSPFYSFWKAKMHIGLLQINGAKICTTANQGDAYMKFVTEAMLNFWTLGIYGKCCSGRTSYGRWLDRHVLWQGAPPRGYNNRELAPLELLFPPPAPAPRLAWRRPPRSHPARVSYLRREARLLPTGQGIPVWAAAQPLRWVPLYDPVCRTSSNTSEWTSRLCCSRLPPHSAAGSSVGSGHLDWRFLGTCTPSSWTT